MAVAGAVDVDADIDTIKSKTHVPTGEISRLNQKPKRIWSSRGELDLSI